MQQGTPTWNEPQILIVTPPLNKHGIGHHTGFSIALDAEHGLLAQFSYRSPKSGTQFISRHFLMAGQYAYTVMLLFLYFVAILFHCLLLCGRWLVPFGISSSLLYCISYLAYCMWLLRSCAVYFTGKRPFSRACDILRKLDSLVNFETDMHTHTNLRQPCLRFAPMSQSSLIPSGSELSKMTAGR